MSETQRVYSRLVDKMPEELATRELESFLFDVSSGTNAFNLRTQETGDSVMSAVVEWTRWFEFLLPSLIERSHEPVGFHTLGEQTVTAVFHFFPDDLDVYAGFRDDLLDTLGRCLMKPELFPYVNGSRRYARELRVNRAGLVVDGAISALFMFALHFLDEGEIESWLASAFAIEDPSWRLELLAWLLGALDIVSKREPSEWNRASPRLDWDGSFLLEALDARERRRGRRLELWPADHRSAFLRATSVWCSQTTVAEVRATIERYASPEVASALKIELERQRDVLERLGL